MSNEILTARKGPVLEITLNRPQIGNAASDAMAVELAKLLLGAGESAEIVVLRGAGEDFCVGRETMGKRPPGMTLDRIDVNGNYEPGNLRWADAKGQANNRRTASGIEAEVIARYGVNWRQEERDAVHEDQTNPV